MQNQEGIYLYCLTLPEGREGLQNVQRQCREHQASLHLLDVHDVVAITGSVNLFEWMGPVGDSHLKDLAWVAPRACLHEGVIERVMRHFPVLPARFATIFTSKESLRGAILGHYGEILRFLEIMRDKEEWCVKGLFDRKMARECVLRRGEKELDSPHLSSGARYLREKRRQGEAEKELRSYLRATSEAFRENLSQKALEIRPLKSLPREVSGRDMDMLFNYSLLMLCDQEETIHEALRGLTQTFSDIGLEVDVSGPWPPYSFCPSLVEQKDEA